MMRDRREPRSLIVVICVRRDRWGSGRVGKVVRRRKTRCVDDGVGRMRGWDDVRVLFR